MSKAPLRLDPNASFSWSHSITLTELSAFPFRTDTLTRRDSSRTDTQVSIHTRALGAQTTVVLAPVAPAAPILLATRDSLGRSTSPELDGTPLPCPATLTPTFARWLVAPRDTRGDVSTQTFDSRFIRCAGRVALVGQFRVQWSEPSVSADGRYQLHGAVSGSLNADSSSALPLTIRGTIRGTAQLVGTIGALLGDSLIVQYQLTYRTMNARVSQTLVENGVASLLRR